MSRNSIFIILGVISAGIAYVFSPELILLVQLGSSGRMPHNFSRMIQNNDLVTGAEFISLFSLSFFLLYVIFPVSYVWYHINSAQNIVADLPPASNLLQRTSKEVFLSQLKDIGFVGRLAQVYSASLIQEAEREVDTKTLENVEGVKKNVSRNKSRKIVISPVRATIPAMAVFNVDSLVNDNLLLGFFNIFAKIIIAIGGIFFGLSLVFPSRIDEGQGLLMSAMQPGIIALLYCLVAATIILGFGRLLELVLAQNSRALAKKITGLFHHGDWQQDLKILQTHLMNNSAAEQFGAILQSGFDKPMREISRAVKMLAGEQEKKLDNILSATLDNFVANMEKKAAMNVENLNKALKEAAGTAELMRKQVIAANSDFSRQMDKQATIMTRHITNMQKLLVNSEKITRTGAEKIISSLTTEVKATHMKFDNFITDNLKKLDERQLKLDQALNNKNSILKDLHNSAKDLGTISNASGILLERFIALSGELDKVLEKSQKNSTGHDEQNSKKRDRLIRAMVALKRVNQNSTSDLPEM